MIGLYLPIDHSEKIYLKGDYDNDEYYNTDYNEFGSSNQNIRWYSPHISHARGQGNLRKNKSILHTSNDKTDGSLI